MDSSPERPLGHETDQDTGRDEPSADRDAAAPATDASTGDTGATGATTATEATGASQPDAAIVASVVVPGGEGPSSGAASGNGEAEEGGEWNELLETLRAWWHRADIPTRLSQARRPAQLLASAALLLLALRLYAAIVHLIDSVPVVSGLLELTGLVVAVRFGATRLVRRSDREQVLRQLRARWQSFRGQD